MTLGTLPALIAAGDILPDTTEINRSGHLEIGGCDVVALARQYGTPLYVVDVATIRDGSGATRRRSLTPIPGRRA